jgi:hypothetical protein
MAGAAGCSAGFIAGCSVETSRGCRLGRRGAAPAQGLLQSNAHLHNAHAHAHI